MTTISIGQAYLGLIPYNTVATNNRNGISHIGSEHQAEQPYIKRSSIIMDKEISPANLTASLNHSIRSWVHSPFETVTIEHHFPLLVAPELHLGQTGG